MKKIFAILATIISIDSAYALNLNSEIGRSALDAGVKECVSTAMEESGYKYYGLLFNQQERQMYTKLCTCAMKKTLSGMTMSDLIAVGMGESPAIEQNFPMSAWTIRESLPTYE